MLDLCEQFMDPKLPLHGLQAFILAKNESANILRGVLALEKFGSTVTILDSGSNDGTLEMIAQHSTATALSYNYRDHVTAYSDVLLRMATDSIAAIFDADMRVSPELASEMAGLMRRTDWDVVVAPVEWWCEGHPIPRASMYPPKPFLFRTGRAQMLPRGHGEAIVPDARVVKTRARLIHDDRKGLVRFLESQVRYARNMLRRAESGELGWRDWVRIRTPVMVLAVAPHVLILKRGVRDGLPGVIYALDRLIAETIFIREAIAQKLSTKSPDER